MNLLRAPLGGEVVHICTDKWNGPMPSEYTEEQLAAMRDHALDPIETLNKRLGGFQQPCGLLTNDV
jgi:hypothetical protein